ncbi:MAG: hypothetical protein HUJ53_03645 [Holdemanella sp.]|nr:hypothetical protein [Holdemanella sp.]
MILYDTLIEKTNELIGKSTSKSYAYNPKKIWPETKSFELILQKEMAYELGGDGKQALNYTMVTTDSKYFNGDEVIVYGPDLKDIKGSVPYVRITMLLTTDIESDDEFDTETAFRAIQEMDFIKYHVFPVGYMVRTSGQTSREQVRISKKAIKEGISFERIGDTFIKHYKQNENVRNAKVIFVTAPDVDYSALKDTAKKVTDITKSLSKILEGMPTECGSCGLKDICDEVEGLKELHFGKKTKK